MKTWEEYIEEELSKYIKFDDLMFSNSSQSSKKFPKILYISTSIIERNKNNLLIVFPELKQYTNLFLLFHIIYRIDSNEFSKEYDPTKFKKDDLLKCGNSVARFDRIEKNKSGKELIWIENANGMMYGVPIDLAPVFQHTSTKKKLSKYEKFYKEFKKQEKERRQHSEDQLVMKLKNLRTHTHETICIIASQNELIEFFQKNKMNGYELTELFYVSRLDKSGKIISVTKGKLEGKPEIIISTSLYSAIEAIETGLEINKVILPIYNLNKFQSELDAFDEILNFNIEILCLCGMEMTPYLEQLEMREFPVWEWNKQLTLSLFQNKEERALHEIQDNYVNRVEHYIQCQNNSLETALKELFYLNRYLDEYTGKLVEVYSFLYKKTYEFLNKVSPINFKEIVTVKKSLEYYYEMVIQYQLLLSESQNDSFRNAFEAIADLYSRKSIIDKMLKLEEYLLNISRKKVCIVMKKSKFCYEAEEYLLKRINIKKFYSVNIMNYKEFLAEKNNFYDLVIITGWFGEKKMRSIINAYNSSELIILLYEIEDKWRKAHEYQWTRHEIQNNNDILLSDITGISNTKNINTPVNTEVENSSFGDFDDYIGEYIFSKYARSDYNNENDEESVDAIPIKFHDDSYGFFKETHKMIVINELFNENGSINNKETKNVYSGDFIVMRETAKDILRDLADEILNKNDMGRLREKASEWHMILKVQMDDNVFSDVYKRLYEMGCHVSKLTVRNWINNTDMITPQKLEHVEIILALAKNSYGLKRAKEIFEAGKQVKRAHIKAGKILTKLLKVKLRNVLNDIDLEYIDLDEKVEFEIENIGTVRLLLIEEVFESKKISKTILNKLLDDWRR